MASHESAVQNLFHYIVFFSIYHFWWWRQTGLLTGSGVFQSLEQLDYIEDWMELRHGGWELEAVCVLANSLCHCEGSEIAMGKFLRGMCGTDVARVQVYSIPDVIFWSRNLALVVVLSYVFFGLREGGPGLREHGVHLVSEFVDGLELGFWLVWFKAHPWVSAGVKHEGSLLSGRMHMVVVLEFS